MLTIYCITASKVWLPAWISSSCLLLCSVALSLIIAGESDDMDVAEHEQGTVIFIFWKYIHNQ
jgi:hypothetical protein